MPFQPALDSRVLMGAVVVHHQVRFHFDREFSIQMFQEFEKLLMTMPGKTLTNDLTLGQFERRKERRGTVAFVVMGHGPTAAPFQRQTRLRTIQRLNLAFLVHAEHQRLLRRIEIKTHHVGQFLQKPGITRQFERLVSMRLKTESSAGAEMITMPNLQELFPARGKPDSGRN